MTRFFLCLALIAFADSKCFAQGGGGGGGGGAAGGSGASSASGSMTLTSGNATNGTAGLASIGTQSTTGGGGSSASSQSLSTTNFLSGSFNNPYYPGRPNSTQLGIGAGSGSITQPSFCTTSSAIGGNGATATRGGTAGVTTGARTGGTTGTSTATRYTGGSLGITNSQISYMAVLKFATPPVDERQKQVDLQQSLSSTASIENGANYQVSYSQGVAVVRGSAKDDDEKRLVENMLRLEPGVREVRNEIVVK